MFAIEVLTLSLIALVAAVATIEKHARVPYPILLVICGVVLAWVPNLPAVRVEPEMVFFLILPAILYRAASDTSWIDFRANFGVISRLAVGLVLATMIAVAVIAHAFIDHLDWSAAFLLGAIVSPPDAVAAMAICQRLGVPRRLLIVLEGESMVNDATSLVAYKIALIAVVTGTFSISQAALDFVWDATGGVLLGLTVGWVSMRLRRSLNNTPVELTVSLLTPFAAYLPAEQAGVSGVLATVTAGLYLGWRRTEFSSPATRIRTAAVWDTVVFLLNGFAFLLIGFELPDITERVVSQWSAATLLGWAALVSLVVISIRLIWTFAGTGLWWLVNRAGGRSPTFGWRHSLIIGWTGMRGIVTLAAALAIPFATPANATLTDRDLIIFLSFVVVLVTLLLQGLTLPVLIRGLGILEARSPHQEEISARLQARLAGLARIEEIAASEGVPENVLSRVRHEYDYQIRHLQVLVENRDETEDERNAVALILRLKREALRAAQDNLTLLRNEGNVGYDALRRIQHALDLEEAALDGFTSLRSDDGTLSSKR